jgi:enamine deaminase RidA (YjgF/YER057c/UK114 family)
MTVRTISSGSEYEKRYAYSRGVVDDTYVFLSGTTAIKHPTTDIDPDVGDQTRQILKTVTAALDDAGSSLADVIRLRYCLTNRADWDAVGTIVGKSLGGARPAVSLVFCELLDPRMKVMIEVTARRRK